MQELPPVVTDTCDAVWERLQASLRAGQLRRLKPVDRLAVEALTRHHLAGESYADALAALGNPTGLSTATLTRRWKEWEPLGCLEPLTGATAGDDWKGALQRAMARRSYPWYCRHLRTQAGLLLDDELLRRAVNGDRPPEPALLRTLGLDPGPLALVRQRAEQVAQALRHLTDDQPVLALDAPVGSDTASILGVLTSIVHPLLAAEPPDEQPAAVGERGARLGPQSNSLAADRSRRLLDIGAISAVHTWRPVEGASDADAARTWFAHAMAGAGGSVGAGELLSDGELRRRLLATAPPLLLVQRGACEDVLPALRELLVDTPARAVVATDGASRHGWCGPSLDLPRLTPKEAAALLREVLGFRGRLSGPLEPFAREFWTACGGRLGEAEALAEQVRGQIRLLSSGHPETEYASDQDLLARAWQAVLAANGGADQAIGVRDHAAAGWQHLSPEQRTLLQVCAALPPRAWPAEHLALLAGVPAATLDLPALVAAGWLVPSWPSGDDHFVCPNWTRRAAQAPPAPLPELLAALLRLWRQYVAPLLHAQRSYAAVLATYETAVEDALVVATLAAVERALDEPAPLRPASTLLRVAWRHLSDILQPSGRTQLHLRLVRLGDRLLDAVAADVASLDEDTEWADLAAEHALIATEHCFMCWSVRELTEAEAALDHAAALLPPLTAALAHRSGQRQCLLTAHANIIAYRVLLVRDSLARGTMPAEEAIRQLLALLDRHAAVSQAESDDEQWRRLSRAGRRNYPAWWEEGRTVARYHYWRALCWLALADLARTAAPERHAGWIGEARREAAAGYRGYAERGRRDRRDRERAWYALLLQGEVERAAGQPEVAPAFADAAARAAAASRRPDLAAVLRVEGASLWKQSGAPNWRAGAERALRSAWSAAGRAPGGMAQALVRYRAERILGEEWRPRSSPRHH